MVSWNELYIQSNLPIIIIFILVISIAIIGYLEYRKVSLQIEELTKKIEKLSNSDKIKDPNSHDEQMKYLNKNEDKNIFQKKDITENTTTENIITENTTTENTKGKDTMKGTINRENTKNGSFNNHMNHNEMNMDIDMDMENMVGTIPNIASMVLGGGPIMSMTVPMNLPEMVGGEKIYEEDIKNNITIDEEMNDKYSEINEDEKELDIKEIKIKNDLSKHQKNETNIDTDSEDSTSESGSSQSSETKISYSSHSSEEEGIHPLQKKNNPIEINRSLSIKDL